MWVFPILSRCAMPSMAASLCSGSTQSRKASVVRGVASSCNAQKLIGSAPAMHFIRGPAFRIYHARCRRALETNHLMRVKKSNREAGWGLSRTHHFYRLSIQTLCFSILPAKQILKMSCLLSAYSPPNGPTLFYMVHKSSSLYTTNLKRSWPACKQAVLHVFHMHRLTPNCAHTV